MSDHKAAATHRRRPPPRNAGAGAASTSQPGRNWAWNHFFLPLYVRLKPDAIANQETRGMIRGYIRVHPGDCYSDIKRNLDLSMGTVTYHLEVLEREKLIQSQNQGSRKRYYEAGVSMPENGGGVHEIQLRAAKVATERPGLSMGDLAGVLGVSKPLARHHVRGLQLKGPLVTERKGLKVLVYPRGARGRSCATPPREGSRGRNATNPRFRGGSGPRTRRAREPDRVYG